MSTILYARAGKSRMVAKVTLGSKTAPEWVAEESGEAKFTGPFKVVSDGPVDDPTAGNLTWQDIVIPQGCTAILGTAGTGKSTLLRELRKRLDQEKERAAVFVPYFEPDYPDALTDPEAFAQALLAAIQVASPSHGYVLVDSLRAWVTLGSGYESRLSSGGWDLTMFPALTALDTIAKRAGVHVIAAVYVDAMQISAAAPGDTVRSNALMQLLMQAVDGSVESTVLLGPARNERGQFAHLNRLARTVAPIKGEIKVAMPDAIDVSTWTAPSNAPVLFRSLSINGVGAEHAREIALIDAQGSDNPVRDVAAGRLKSADGDAILAGPPKRTATKIDTRAIHAQLRDQAGSELDD